MNNFHSFLTYEDIDDDELANTTNMVEGLTRRHDAKPNKDRFSQMKKKKRITKTVIKEISHSYYII